MAHIVIDLFSLAAALILLQNTERACLQVHMENIELWWDTEDKTCQDGLIFHSFTAVCLVWFTYPKSEWISFDVYMRNMHHDASDYKLVIILNSDLFLH